MRTVQTDEQKFYGVHATQALFEARPNDIVRLYLTKERMAAYAELMKWCARQKKAYHIVTDEELEKIAASVHHEGVLLLAKRHLRLNDKTLVELAVQRAKAPADVMVYLDGVQNPHNIGSMLRVAAHFGASALLGRKDELPPMTPSACRVAEGGAERVPMADLTVAEATLRELKALGYTLLATSSHGGDRLYAKPLPKHCVLLLGAEVTGMSQKLTAIADRRLQIPGTGIIESLNVAMATGILLSEHWRAHGVAVAPSTAPSRR